MNWFRSGDQLVHDLLHLEFAATAISNKKMLLEFTNIIFLTTRLVTVYSLLETISQF